MKFIHTADWQIGKPYNRIKDEEKRSLLKNERIEAVKRIEHLVKEESAQFVLIAGDLFDSPTPSKSNVVSTLSAIGKLKVPVYVIPGNHDFGGPGSLWEQDFFLKEQKELAPNLEVLQEAKPIVTKDAVILPCPLLRRHETRDLLSWIDKEMLNDLPEELPRIVLAHGSVQEFDSSEMNDEDDEGASNYLNLENLNLQQLDYIAMGDWHGTKQINNKAWYSGTHETDRFPKGEQNNPGNILVVEVERNGTPAVQTKRTSGMKWHVVEDKINSKVEIESLQSRIYELTDNRTNKDLLHLTLTGALGLNEWEDYQKMMTSIKARLIRVKEYGRIDTAPTENEILRLSERSGDQLTQKVAVRLIEQLDQPDNEQAEVAAVALRKLYITINNQ